jgi:hypothetical protein
MQKIIALLYILFIILISIHSSRSSLNAQSSLSSFEDRKQDWLNRNGMTLEGDYDTDPHYGRFYLFAWAEKNLYISEAMPGMGTFHDQLMGLFEKRSNAGSTGGLNISRIFYQYENLLKDASYPHPDDWQYIKNALSGDAWSDSHIDTRGWLLATQAERTVTMFLYTLEYDLDATVYWPTGTYTDLTFTSSYSGKKYIPGRRYNSYELSRDWLFEAMDTWTRRGSSELDGNYSGYALHSLLLLYDFADRPLKRLDGRPHPDGTEMKKRAKMTLDLLLLDQMMDCSANQRGGVFGRAYRFNIVHDAWKSLYHAYFGMDKGGTDCDGDAYISSYRVPNFIEDLASLNDETNAYWHIHTENNRVSTDDHYGKWTYITRHFNLGADGPDGNSWQLSINSEDDQGPRVGQPFRLWIDSKPSSADPNESIDPQTTTGNGRLFQFRNAAFLDLWSGGHIHVCLDGNSFDIGHDQLTKASQYAQDFSIGSGWKFFRENKVAIALRLDDGKLGALEVVIIDPNINADHCYPSFQDFQDAVNRNCAITDNSFKTSRGYLIEGNASGGKVNGQPIWTFPFKRMETVDYRGNKLISWQNNIMIVKKNNDEIVYDFNNWKFYDSGFTGDISAPSPPSSLSISPGTNP